MKKIILFSFAFITLTFFTKSVYGLSPTASPSATPALNVSKEERLINQINVLREKVASKVAELNLVEKRGIIITVSEVSGNKITGMDPDDNIRISDVDELTKFSSPSAKTFGISDITKGDKLSIIGLYNKQSKRILSRFVDSVTLPKLLSGEITDVDKINYTVIVLSENKIKTLVDIENITKTSSYTQESGLERLGFSKLTIGDRILVNGYQNIKDKYRITATRIIVFPELPKNPKINLLQPTSSEPTGNIASPSGILNRN
jgi:hypothetical protein